MQKVNFGVRLGSGLIDIFGFLMVCGVVTLLSVFAFRSHEVSHTQIAFIKLTGPAYYIMLLFLAFFLCKDNFGGRSPGKRSVNLVVVDVKTEEVASPLKCMLRNITVIILPFEVMAVIGTPSRRIGDMIAGTKVSIFDPAVHQSKYSRLQSFAPLTGAFLIFNVIGFLTSWSGRINYVESSYNEAESKELARVMVNGNDKYIDRVDARVYDRIENKNMKYVSLIYYLKHDYISIDDRGPEAVEYRNMIRTTDSLVADQFPQTAFRGEVQLIYESESSFAYSSHVVGTHY